MNRGFPVPRHVYGVPFVATVSCLVIALALALAVSPPSLAAPTDGSHPMQSPAQNVDYLGTEAGAALDLGFPVLVPGWVPAPFGGSPAVDAGGGSYSLYWMNGGGEPTFLQVTGVVGGGLPAGSPYDLNIELTINASVNGYGAIHDVTPIYDAVWWIQGGVLYSVQSRNMTGTDSLSLANSLIEFVPPSAPEPTSPPATEPPPPTDPPVDQSNSDEGGQGGDTGNEPAVDESAPPAAPTTPENIQDDGTTEQEETTGGAPAAQDQPAVTADPGQETLEDTGTAEQGEGDDAPPPEPSAPAVGSDGTGVPSVASDGTGGPPVEIISTDGTGGDIIVIPRRSPVLQPIE